MEGTGWEGDLDQLRAGRDPGAGGTSATTHVSWDEIRSRLASWRIYWLQTTNPDGAPHAIPVWGVVVGGALYVYSQRSTVKARNIRNDPRVTIHGESGADVVIVRGRLSDRGRPSESMSITEAFAEKYDHPDERPFLPSENPDFDVLYRFEPERALVWNLPDSEASMRRWSASDP